MDTTAKIRIKKAYDSKREITIIPQAEPIYTVDKKDLWIGDNKTTGGIWIGGESFGMKVRDISLAIIEELFDTNPDGSIKFPDYVNPDKDKTSKYFFSNMTTGVPQVGKPGLLITYMAEDNNSGLQICYVFQSDGIVRAYSRIYDRDTQSWPDDWHLISVNQAVDVNTDSVSSADYIRESSVIEYDENFSGVPVPKSRGVLLTYFNYDNQRGTQIVYVKKEDGKFECYSRSYDSSLKQWNTEWGKISLTLDCYPPEKQDLDQIFDSMICYFEGSTAHTPDPRYPGLCYVHFSPLKDVGYQIAYSRRPDGSYRTYMREWLGSYWSAVWKPTCGGSGNGGEIFEESNQNLKTWVAISEDNQDTFTIKNPINNDHDKTHYMVQIGPIKLIDTDYDIQPSDTDIDTLLLKFPQPVEKEEIIIVKYFFTTKNTSSQTEYFTPEFFAFDAKSGDSEFLFGKPLEYDIDPYFFIVQINNVSISPNEYTVTSEKLVLKEALTEDGRVNIRYFYLNEAVTDIYSEAKPFIYWESNIQDETELMVLYNGPTDTNLYNYEVQVDGVFLSVSDYVISNNIIKLATTLKGKHNLVVRYYYNPSKQTVVNRPIEFNTKVWNFVATSENTSFVLENAEIGKNSYNYKVQAGASLLLPQDYTINGTTLELISPFSDDTPLIVKYGTASEEDAVISTYKCWEFVCSPDQTEFVLAGIPTETDKYQLEVQIGAALLLPQDYNIVDETLTILAPFEDETKMFVRYYGGTSQVKKILKYWEFISEEGQVQYRLDGWVNDSNKYTYQVQVGASLLSSIDYEVNNGLLTITVPMESGTHILVKYGIITDGQEVQTTSAVIYRMSRTSLMSYSSQPENKLVIDESNEPTRDYDINEGDLYTTLNYAVGLNQIQVFVDGIRMSRDKQYVEVGEYGELVNKIKWLINIQKSSEIVVVTTRFI